MENNTETAKNSEQSPYWLSWEQLEKDPKFQELVETEFKSSPLREGESESGVARRDFMKLMGASLAMSATACIRRPVQYIVPYAQRPKDVIPGVANYYASSWVESGGEGFGLVVKTREGRPLHVAGNLESPINRSGLSARAYTHVLQLYDPDRVRGPKRNLLNKTRTDFDTVDVDWASLDTAMKKQLEKGGVAILSSTITSPTLRQTLDSFKSAKNAQHFVWEPLGADDVMQGQKDSYGSDVMPRLRFDLADVVVSIDADFLGTWIAPTEFTRLYSERRRQLENLNKLIVFESMYSVTGAAADVRGGIRPSQQLDVVMAILREIIVNQKQSRFANDRSVLDVINRFSSRIETVLTEQPAITKTAAELWASKGKSLVVTGGLTTRGPWSRDLQVAVNFLNSILENDGVTVEHTGSVIVTNDGRASELQALIKKMQAGQIKTLIIHGVNPVYTLSEQSGFTEALKKVEAVVYTGLSLDETGGQSHYLAPDHHPLEAWGDHEVRRGVYQLQQPTIAPLYDTRAFGETLSAWMGQSKPWYDVVRESWRTQIINRAGRGDLKSADFDGQWNEILQSGVIGSLKSGGGARAFRTEAFRSIQPAAQASNTELVLYPTVALGDGQMANMSWLQELPDPITRITWDNYLCVSPTVAKAMELKDGVVVKAQLGDVSYELPVLVQPGLHAGTMALAVGYGRTAAGRVGNDIGFNAFSLVQWNDNGPVLAGMPIKIEKTKRKYPLASVQEHHVLEHRHLLGETTAEDYKKDPKSGKPQSKVFSIWPDMKYTGHKWAMSIDTNICTGCSACVISCQSENNIPVVGKKYVLESREMHWIRMDRYYRGSLDNPQVSYQPMLCQHCDNAPCETVCPVVATSHSTDGINEMTYNRCVGTRYCSNNCPYKVRRFNWFNYTKKFEEPLQLSLNPAVTVRSRGVMEKCTLCVHRIREGTSLAKDENRKVRDGEIKTACQESCPADCITFGDMNDPDSKVSQAFKNARSYAVLEELNTVPSVRYMTRVRNVEQLPESFASHHGKGEHT